MEDIGLGGFSMIVVQLRVCPFRACYELQLKSTE